MEWNVYRIGHRHLAGVAMGGLLAVLSAGSAHALTYTSGDLVTVFVNGGVEYVADLGPLSSLTTTPIVLSTVPSGGTSGVLGPNGGLGGIFTAFETMSPFSGTTRTITFTSATTVNPPSFDNNLTAYVSKIPSSQSALDGGAPANGWLQNLTGFPPVGTGGVTINTANLLSYPGTNASSYTTVLNGSGLNEIGGNLPFSTAASLTANGEVVDVWSGARTGLTSSHTTLLGTLTVDGNFGTGTSGTEVRITFTPVPEPGALVLVASGIAGLVWAGRRRSTE